MELKSKKRIIPSVKQTKERPVNTAKLSDADRKMIDDLMRQPVAPPTKTSPLLDRIR